MASDITEKSRSRSPAYPFIDLAEAIEKADAVYKVAKRAAVAPEVLIADWGYAEKSSGGRMTLSALKKFGLLEEVGGGNSRQLRLTRLAVTILLSVGPEHQAERLEAIREAALTPAIYRELWEQWKADLPSDSAIRMHLIRERDFNDSIVGDFIKNYKNTLAFARLDDMEPLVAADGVGTMRGGDDEEDNPPSPRAEASMIPPPMTQPPALAAPAPPSAVFPATPAGSPIPQGMIEMPVPLRDGVFFYLRVPADKELKKVHFQQLKRYVSYLESAMASDAFEEEGSDRSSD